MNYMDKFKKMQTFEMINIDERGLDIPYIVLISWLFYRLKLSGFRQIKSLLATLCG